jgi:RNA polymerase sigma-70 factor, ECF subfamily
VSLSPAATDRELLSAHVAGDPNAFGELVRRHRNRLWAIALRTLADREEAADALQDALIAAFRNAGGFRGDAAVTTWLHRIVINACLDRLRRRRTRPTEPLQDRDLARNRDDHHVTEIRLDLWAALQTLPEPQRLAIVLVDMEDLPVSEAATILGIAEGTVKSRCSRGRATLARVLRPGPVDERDSGPELKRLPPTGNHPGSPNVASVESPCDTPLDDAQGHTPTTGGGR